MLTYTIKYLERYYMQKYFLLPTVCIKVKNHKFYLKNVMYDFEPVECSDLRKIIPTEELVQTHIFAKLNRIQEVKEELLNKLENQFSKMPTEIGYIETTTNCPYLCKMCPKGSNKLERRVDKMSVGMFSSIVDQLNKQAEVTLHLFGDPLFDDDLPDKIKYANVKGIIPSFSTNLISLKKMDMQKYKKIKIKNLTISIDTIFGEQIEKIRGNTSKAQIEEGWHCLEKIISEIDIVKFIEKIFLQSITMTVNESTRRFLKEYVEDKNNVEFYEKVFIEFPNTHDFEYKETVCYQQEEWIWLYGVIGVKLPFKCLKPWVKREMGILADGRVLPCCMCYNATSELGSIKTELISDIQEGEVYKNFRRQIWEGKDCGVVCTGCGINEQKFYHREIECKQLSYLKQYSVEQW